ncbi:uncharacterized protein B4U80_12584, partial [Leptotrombidium deliense]
MSRHKDNLCKEEIETFNDAVHVVLLKEEARLLNDLKQSQFKDFKIFNAEDYFSDGREVTPESIPKKIEADVPRKLKLAVGSKVMLKVNIDVSSGLVNGLLGTVTEFDVDDNYDTIIMVKFDDSFKNNFERFRLSYPIKPYKFRTRVAHKRYFIRRQYPLIHSWAINVHKVQGITLNKA